MTSLILATNLSAGSMLRGAERADIAVGIVPRYVLGHPPSQAELGSLLGTRSAKHHGFGTHWLDGASLRQVAAVGGEDFGLLKLCERCDSIELWADPFPNDQLILMWLLDAMRPHRDIVSKLTLVQSDVEIRSSVAQWRLPKLAVTDDRLRLAGRAWTAYCAPTPEPCFDLLMEDLTAIPRLRPALVTLLEELPARQTGLGATEYEMLSLLSEGSERAIHVIGDTLGKREVFDIEECRFILDGLAYCRTPVLTGFPATREEPGDVKERDDRFMHSHLSITDFGREVLEGELDFSQYNTIDRWWGGTVLSSDRLWRWEPYDRCLIAP